MCSINNSGVSRTETFRNWVKIGGVDADVESEDAERITLRDIHTNSSLPEGFFIT